MDCQSIFNLKQNELNLIKFDNTQLKMICFDYIKSKWVRFIICYINYICIWLNWFLFPYLCQLKRLYDAELASPNVQTKSNVVVVPPCPLEVDLGPSMWNAEPTPWMLKCCKQMLKWLCVIRQLLKCRKGWDVKCVDMLKMIKHVYWSETNP